MTSKISLLKFIIAGFIISIALMVWYIAAAYKKTSSTIVIPSITTSTAPTKEARKAFVNVKEHPNTAKRGGVWSVEMEAPTWAKCIADVYDPSGQVRIFENVKDTEATLITPGQFNWTWRVPSDPTKGQWTIKLLCGTFDNLATTDVSVQVE